MKVRMYHDFDNGWLECQDGEPIELPDAIITEWRALTERLAEIEDYFDEKIPPLQREADEKIPPKPLTPTEARWHRLMFNQFLKGPSVLINMDEEVRIVDDVQPKKDAAD